MNVHAGIVAKDVRSSAMSRNRAAHIVASPTKYFVARYADLYWLEGDVVLR